MFVGLLTSHDYATSALQFAGFLIFILIYKAFQIKSMTVRDTKSIIDLFFKHFYSHETKKLSFFNITHLVLRSINFFGLSWLLIISSAYAVKAEINFGIIASCMSIQTPLNCILGIFFWKEKLTWKMIFGIVVCMSGVIWVSMARGQSTKDSDYISTTS